MVKRVQFPNLRGTTVLLFCFILMFYFRISNNYFVVHQKAELSNVCALTVKYNAYGEKLMIYGYSLMKRQQLERTNNMSSKIQLNWCLHVFYMHNKAVYV